MAIVETEKILVFNNGRYYSYQSSDWVYIADSVTKDDYLDFGFYDISNISEATWAEFQGEVEICYYTDDPNKTEVSFNVETEPFTLDDIFSEGFDVFYYTENPNRTSAELELTANYSPLDEIEGDFDIVTWTNAPLSDPENPSANVILSALPTGQFIVNPNPILSFGEIRTISSEITQQNLESGIIRFLLSFNNGVTWRSFKNQSWEIVTHTDKNQIVEFGMTSEELNLLTDGELGSIFTPSTKIAYYLEEHIRKAGEVQIDSVRCIADAGVYDIKLTDLAFYLLNTVATINLTFLGNKLTGVLSDEDEGKVRYRVFLNENPYFPISGQFTSLAPSPVDISLVLDDRKINIGQQNTLRVEFQDYWGQVDSWAATFTGTYSGILFSDENGELYSTSFGEIIKNLDFGQIIAGQTSLDQKVVLLNNIGYNIKNIQLNAVPQFQDSSVDIELSKAQSPFIGLSQLNYAETLEHGESLNFYVRVSTTRSSKGNPTGKFEVRVKADRDDIN